MTKMLEDLAEVVRPGTMIPYTKGHFEQQKTKALQFVVYHHATITDMAKRLEAAERDAERLNFLDACNLPMKMGWNISMAPMGNVSAQVIIQLGGKVTPIRQAIDAAMQESGEWTKGVG